MKQALAISLATAATLAATPALAFEPIAFEDVQGLIGKTVYAGANTALEEEVWVYAGEPLTMVEAKPWSSQYEGTEYNFLVVKNAEGKTGEVQIRLLSKKPLKYNLRKPPKGEKLIVAVLEDAYEIPAKMHKIRSKYNYDLNSSIEKDGKHHVNGDYHVVDSMSNYYEFASRLIHNLVYSSNNSKEQLMRNGETRWLAAASDDRLLDWYADGMKDALKKKYVPAKDTLSRLDHVSHHGFDIARLVREKEEKDWRRGMEGVPESKIKKIEAEKLGEISKEIKDKEAKIKAAFAEAAKMKKKVR